MKQTQQRTVATVSIDSLEKAERDPSINREDMQVLRNVAV